MLADVPEGKPRTVRWLVIAVLGVAVVTVVAGLAARQVYRGSGQPVGESAAAGETTEPPGSPTVGATEDARRHPLYEPVREMLQRHFNAINDHSYERWTETVTTGRVKATPKERWFRDYRSTKDGSIVVYRLETASDEQARVLIELVSVQEPGDAPPQLQVGCIRWHVVYPLAQENGEWRIDGGSAGASAQLERC
jgi:hypothetical protein